MKILLLDQDTVCNLFKKMFRLHLKLTATRSLLSRPRRHNLRSSTTPSTSPTASMIQTARRCDTSVVCVSCVPLPRAYNYLSTNFESRNMANTTSVCCPRSSSGGTGTNSD
jgi:hypothetical protein